MLVQTIHTTTTNLGHLILDVPTEYLSKNIEVVLVINEIKTETSTKKYDFSDLIGKLEWQGDALAEQKRLRNEWE
jgi:predicted deacetylase